MLENKIIKIEQKHVKNPNWQEADRPAIYKRSWGVELRATKK